MLVEYLSRKRGSIKAWVGKLLMQVVTVMLLVGMTMAGNVQAASSCDVVKNGLVACYPFDGNANDASTNGNNGTVNGATLTADRFGKQNSAYQFDGNSYIEVKDSNSLDLTTGLTMVAWVNSRGQKVVADICAGCGGIILNKELAYEMTLTENTSLIRYALFLNGSMQWSDTGVSVPLNQWTLIVISYDGDTEKVYKNGELVHQRVVKGSIPTTNYPLGIGSRKYPWAGGDQWVSKFNGQIDDVSIYNRALTEEEIKKLYQLKDSPLPACEHAVYSVTNNIGKLVIPFVDIPLLNLYTHLPTGELAVFSGELKQVSSSMDFGLVSSKLKLVFLTPAHDPCHAIYDETQKTLHAPFVDVNNEVYDVKFQHLKDIPLELGVFHLESYDLVE